MFPNTEDSVDGGEQTPILPSREPEAEQRDEAAAGASDHGVDDAPGAAGEAYAVAGAHAAVVADRSSSE